MRGDSRSACRHSRAPLKHAQWPAAASINIVKIQCLRSTSAGRPSCGRGRIRRRLAGPDAVQFACRRRNAGMSSWSSSLGLCTGACRPCWSRPCGAARLAYSDTGSGRDSARRAAPDGRQAARAGCGMFGGLRAAGLRLLLVLAAAKTDRGEALQQATCAASPGCSSCTSSPRRARISFCAGTGSSSIRGMRGARAAAAPAAAE